MSTLVVDVYEGQDVAIFNSPVAYMKVDMPDDKDVRLKFEGTFVDIMCNVNPYHIPNIRYKMERR